MGNSESVFRIDPASFNVSYSDRVYLPGTVSVHEDRLIISGAARYQLERRCSIDASTVPLAAHSFEFSAKVTTQTPLGSYSIGIVGPQRKPSIHIAHVLRSSIRLYQEDFGSTPYSAWGYDNNGDRSQVWKDANSVTEGKSQSLSVRYQAETGILSCSVDSLLVHSIEARLDTFQLEISFEAVGVAGPFEIVFEDLFYRSLSGDKFENIEKLSDLKSRNQTSTFRDIGSIVEVDPSKKFKNAPQGDGGQKHLPGTSRTLTWLHLSDLHYRNAHDYNIDVVERALLGDIERMVKDKGLRPDFVAFTGDLAYSAQPDQYEWVEGFLEQLCLVCNLSSRERLAVVPGNHDVNRNVVDPIMAKGILKTLVSRDEVSDFLKPGRDRSYAFTKFTPYRFFYNGYFSGIDQFNDDHYYWVRRLDVGEFRIGLLGINSAWMSGFNKDAEGGVNDYGKLIVGERQVVEAIQHLKKMGGADICIALMHHPFASLNDDFDVEPVESLLRQRCDFILRGHLHRSNMIREYALDGATVTIAAGACYDRRDRTTNGYNFVNLDLAAGKGTIYFRRYNDRRREWVPDIDATGEASGGQVEFAFVK